MFNLPKVEQKVSPHKSIFKENTRVRYRLIKLEGTTFSRDTDVMQHSRKTG